jgi:DNA mismatch repair ATPase MutL
MKQLYSYIQGENNHKTTLYPVYMISLQFAGNEVDVNMEPDKSQVLMTRQVREIFANMSKNVYPTIAHISDGNLGPYQDQSNCFGGGASSHDIQGCG